MGKARKDALRLNFDYKLKLYSGSQYTADWLVTMTPMMQSVYVLILRCGILQGVEQ